MPREFTEADRGEVVAALRLALSPECDWSANEMADLLASQMAAPLAIDLVETLGPQATQAVAGLAEGAIPAIHTFADLVSHPNPPVELLRLARLFAKVSPEHPTRPLPRDLAKVLYYVVLIVARRHGQEISQFSDEALQKGMEWTLAQPWVDETTRGLLRGMEEGRG